MNRWKWLAVLVLAVGMPALADQFRDREWERERGRDRAFREHLVVIEKRRMRWALNRIDNRMSEIIGKSRGMDKRLQQALKDLRDDLNDVRDTIAAAPDLNTVGQPVPVPPGPPGPQTGPYQPPPPQQPSYPPAPQQPPGYYPPNQPPPPPGQPTGRPAAPMADATFRGLLGAMANESFAEGKLRVLDQAAASSWFTVAQVQQILAQLTFPADRLRAVRILRPHIGDTDNFFQLYGSFEFDRDKAELRTILGQ